MCIRDRHIPFHAPQAVAKRSAAPSDDRKRRAKEYAMAGISAFTPESKKQARSGRSIAAAQAAPSNKPRIKVRLLDDAGKLTSTPIFEGRDAWALDQLIRAGKRGCTPIDNPAPRWSHYVR